MQQEMIQTVHYHSTAVKRKHNYLLGEIEGYHTVAEHARNQMQLFLAPNRLMAPTSEDS